jgi:hypothetical protein
MESINETQKLDIYEVIKNLKLSSPSHNKKQKKYFPYMETYGNISTREESHIIGSRYREAFFHDKTLKFSQPYFSCNQVFHGLDKSIQRNSSRRIKTAKKFRNEDKVSWNSLLKRTLDVTLDDKKNCKGSYNNLKSKSNSNKIVYKGVKIESPLKKSYEAISNDILQISKAPIRKQELYRTSISLVNHKKLIKKLKEKKASFINTYKDTDQSLYCVGYSKVFTDAYMNTDYSRNN